MRETTSRTLVSDTPQRMAADGSQLVRGRRGWVVGLTLAWATTLTVSCGRASDAPSGPTLRDSSGVRIVEGVEVEANATWSVPAAPLFRLGWDEGGPTFEDLREGVLLPDGRVVVGDGGSSLLHWISPQGESLYTVGGPGEGPGELSRIAGIVHVSGDTIVVHDAGNVRLNVFAGPELARDVRLETYYADAIYHLDGRYGAGEYLLTPGGLLLGALQGRVGWVSYPVLRLSADLERVDTIVELDYMYMREEGNRNPVRHWGMPIATGDGLAYATTREPEVRWLDPAGSVDRIARLAVAPDEVGDDVWEAYEADYRERTSDMDPATVEQRLAVARRDFGGPQPLFRLAYGDRLGNVWLSAYNITGLEADTFTVVERGGEVAHTVVFPRELRILDIGDDRILGVEMGAFDVQALVVYTLEKGGA